MSSRSVYLTQREGAVCPATAVDAVETDGQCCNGRVRLDVDQILDAISACLCGHGVRWREGVEIWRRIRGLGTQAPRALDHVSFRVV